MKKEKPGNDSADRVLVSKLRIESYFIISKFFMNMDINPVHERLHSQYVCKWTNANPIKILSRLASHANLNWIKTKPKLAGNQIEGILKSVSLKRIHFI